MHLELTVVRVVKSSNCIESNDYVNSLSSIVRKLAIL